MESIKKFLKDYIDENVVIEKFNELKDVPLVYKNNFIFYKFSIFKKDFIIVEAIEEIPEVELLKKQLNKTGEITNKEVILYSAKISLYRRYIYIKNRISFMTGDGQIFIPSLGVLFKKTSKELNEEIDKFTPSVQQAFLYFLNNNLEKITATEYAKISGYTKMTASRILSDLYLKKLIDYRIGGRTNRDKYYYKTNDEDYFTHGKDYLISPVKKIVYVDKEPSNSFIAGLEALSILSMFDYQGKKIRAISEREFKRINIDIKKKNEVVNESMVELQIWHYDPKTFTKTNCVDNLSLYSSLKEENDDRIQIALEEILRR